MNGLKLGFIGFGEAAYHISKGLAGTSKPTIIAFDVLSEDSEKGKVIRERAHQTNVSLVKDLVQLIQEADIILCTTSAKSALAISSEVAVLLGPGKIYADLNSASPMVKKQIAGIVEHGGALFADCAVMEIVPPHQHQVPIAASGRGARELTDRLNSLGMCVSYISDEPGSSSSMKMFRSIFMKGLNALMVETFLASYKLGVCDEVLQSIEDTLKRSSLEELANLLINRTAISYDRRISEMEDVVSTLKEIGVDAFASRATIERLMWMKEIGLKDRLQGLVPNDFHTVLKVILEV